MEPKTTLQSGHPLTDVLKRLDKDRPTLYELVTIDLTAARDLSAGTLAFAIPGDTLAVVSITGTASIVFQDKTQAPVSLNNIRRFITPFSRFWIVNTAQPGMSSLILIGRDASFEGIPISSTKVTDTSGNDINPAELASTPNEYNVAMVAADTEYSQALPAGTHKFIFQCRDGTAIRYAFTTGKVAAPVAPYFSLRTNGAYGEDGLKLTGVTLYFACSIAGKVVELLAWS